MRARIQDNKGFVFTTMGLILLLFFFVTETVQCESSASKKEIENYYLEQENQMVREVRNYLEDSGFCNSGVMLTKVMDGEGERTYTLTIHHKALNDLTKAECEELKEELAGFDFEDESCSFRHVFLRNE